MRAINIIETAYRATIEEQDDTIVWITHALKGAGATLDVLLRGNAVNYGVNGQDASGLAFGAIKQTKPPRLGADITKLVDKGVKVYVIEEDLAERGIEASSLVGGLTPVARAGVAELIGGYDYAWHW